MAEISYNTEFEEFANILGLLFKGEQKPGEFARSLFQAIYLPEKEDNPVEETLLRTYESYFYGERNITELAKKIVGSLDPQNFADKIIVENDSTIKMLCDNFKKYCPEIDENNYSIQIAERFRKIIETAAKAKRTRKKKKNECVAAQTANVTEKYGVALVAEEGSICPNDLCTHSLFSNANGHLNFLYEVVKIDPDGLTDDPANLIALCPECAAKHRLSSNEDNIRRLKEIKNNLKNLAYDQELLSDQKVQEGVRRIVQKIPKMIPSKEVDLNYHPVMINRKILPNNYVLYLKAQSHVNVYFDSVDEAFREMSKEHLLRFTPFCNQVKMNYLNLKEEGRDQVYIYSQLAKWLHDGTNEPQEFCEIVISYFIQKCEVFDVIAE